jgi:hypothetical protein
VDVERLKQEYSSKTDDELLVLLADSGSLVDEAQPLLREELRGRNLSDRPAHIEGPSSAASSFRGAVWLLRAKWASLWLLNTLNATVGVGAAVGSIEYSIRPFAGLATRSYILMGPYYPLPILVSFFAGYFAYRRIRGSYCYWVWILPAVSMMIAMDYWKSSNQATWVGAVGHFFRRLPPSLDRNIQYGTTGVLLMTLTYSLAAFLRSLSDSMTRKVDYASAE